MRAADAKTFGRTRYEDDLYAWSVEQAALIEAGRWAEVDAVNVADEVLSVGKSETRSIVGALVVVLHHMLKWDFQPERRSKSWALSIAEHRAQVEDDLLDSPSFKSRRADIMRKAYRRARLRASRETRLALSALPAVSPYSWDEAMTRAFPTETGD